MLCLNAISLDSAGNFSFLQNQESLLVSLVSDVMQMAINLMRIWVGLKYNLGPTYAYLKNVDFVPK